MSRPGNSKRHAQADRHAVEGAAGLDGAHDLPDVLGAQQVELHQPRQGVLDVRDFLGNQFELVGGLAAGDQFAVAIENQAARRRDRLVAHAIAL
jgi:hypothetical protein